MKFVITEVEITKQAHRIRVLIAAQSDKSKGNLTFSYLLDEYKDIAWVMNPGDVIELSGDNLE